MRNNKDGQSPYEEDLRQVTGDIDIDTEKINIRNDVTLYGGVFKLSPLAFPNAMVDVGQGGYVSGKPITQWGNGRGLFFWKDYDGANQMWAFKPYLDDGVGAFTFALGSLIGPKLVQTLNNNGHVNANSSWKNGTMETGSAVIWDIRKAAGRENSWWIDHEPSATNETDHTCYFLTSDADGQRLDTLGASANGAAVRVSSYACPGVWGGQWMKDVCGLDKEKPNFAWSFDGVPEENSLYLEVEGVKVEIPAMDLVLYQPKPLLGEQVFARFGAEFPIRF